MLSKVSNRVRRRAVSIQEAPIAPRTQAVSIAPELLRWSDFDSPFPPVALGGYGRYYASKTKDSSAQTPNYCPALSEDPESSSSSSSPRQTAIPPKSSLFDFPAASTSSSPPANRGLTIIHEASKESMTSMKLPNLSTSALATPLSLRRRRRQLLRTPSIQRDFAVISRHLFSASTPSVNALSPASIHTPSFSHYSDHSRTSSSSSNSVDHSDESHQFDVYPITPTSSVGSERDGGYGEILVLGDTGHFDLSEEFPEMLKVEEDRTLKRVDSRASFSTARSGFSDD